MKHRTGIALIVACTLAAGSAAVLAQGGGQGGGQRGGGQQQVDRNMDRQMPSKQDRAKKQDRMQQIQQMRDQAQLKDRDIYGHELMSAQERNEYRNRIGNAGSAMQQEQIRAEHQEKIQARAKAQGVALRPASEGPIYGSQFMSVEERNQHRAQLRMIESDQERGEYMAKHHEEMQLRAKEQGTSLEETEVEEAE